MKELRKFNLDLPTNSKIDEIIANPEQFAEEFAQNALETQAFRFFEAKKFGISFAESLLEEKDGI